MPGFIPHFVAGNAMFLIGSTIIHKYATLEMTRKNTFILYFICICCSIIPDFPLALYYLFHIGTIDFLMQPHILLHKIISPIAVFIFIIFSLIFPSKYKPFWAVGVLCILLHILMDALIQESSLWI